MKPSYLLGASIALWGSIICLPTAGLVTSSPWLLWAVALGWGIVYSRRRLSLELLAVQAATVAVATLVSSPINEIVDYPLAIVAVLAYALGYLVVWIAPFGIAHSFICQDSTSSGTGQETHRNG